MSRPLPVRCAAAVVLSLCVGACGGGGGQPAATGAPSPSATTDGTRVSCGLESWPVSAMDGGIDSRFDRAELAAALETFVRAEGTMAPETLQSLPIGDDAWFVLAESGDFVAVATGTWSANGPGADAGVVKLERTGVGWKHAGYGDCRPDHLRRVLPEGLSWVEISALGALDRRSTEIVVGLSERSCSSGRDPRPHLREPSIVEDQDSVTISWTTKAVLVGNCMGAMPVPHQVQLKAPLGDRVLLDGSHWPARAVPEGT